MFKTKIRYLFIHNNKFLSLEIKLKKFGGLLSNWGNMGVMDVPLKSFLRLVVGVRPFLALTLRLLLLR
jgi:hypothetical protein